MVETSNKAAPLPPTGEAFFKIDQVTKRFGDVTAVDNIELDIAKGEIFALLGSSGCGKSTLLRMLAGFETPSSGRVFLAGEDITDLPPYERPINMMFQSYALFPHLTVFDNIAFGLRRDKMDKPAVDQRVEQMLDLVQLKPYAKRKPHQLSGGQQQRVALARSLAKSPKMLLLDEPLAALDKKLRERTQLELVSILRKVGVTCVMVTHDQEEAMTMADRIAVMREGRFLQLGTPSEIYEHPQTRFVADFIGNVNLFEGRLVTDEPDHCEVRCDDGLFHIGHGIAGTLGMELNVALRPEKILLDAGHQTHPHNAVRGVISARSYMGSYTVYEMLLPTQRRLRVTVSNADRHADPFDVGTAVTASWAATSPVVIVD
ncbi:MAG: ABC transporter ATP-binding protein [Betaproteobacteria bacterium]|nr:ABC transporter ATP-binding protein [Betaproteobacteria bacterium]MDE2124356.1 ABC transporter ATP-binding protein [Betaproteobacteria bacterium]MDE2186233.1 ABC transporter ATP-binding protein [Betaproteobacteria bacterium]MDE2324283.1 ABC transporter ATP-binding protein [Betaproteobacteria bacterium]